MVNSETRRVGMQEFKEGRGVETGIAWDGDVPLQSQIMLALPTATGNLLYFGHGTDIDADPGYVRQGL